MVSGSVAVAETVFPAAKSLSTSRSGAGALGSLLSWACAKVAERAQMQRAVTARGLRQRRATAAKLEARWCTELRFMIGIPCAGGEAAEQRLRGRAPNRALLVDSHQLRWKHRVEAVCTWRLCAEWRTAAGDAFISWSPAATGRYKKVEFASGGCMDGTTESKLDST